MKNWLKKWLGIDTLTEKVDDVDTRVWKLHKRVSGRSKRHDEIERERARRRNPRRF